MMVNIGYAKAKVDLDFCKMLAKEAKKAKERNKESERGKKRSKQQQPRTNRGQSYY